MLEAARRIVDGGRPHAGSRAPLHAEGGDRPRRRGRVRPTRGSRRGSATSTTRPRRSASHHRARRPRRRSSSASSGGPRTRGCTRRRGARRSSPPRVRSPTCRLGRIDELTTANVGVIRGGTARNIVPEWCTLEAEARSHDEGRSPSVVQEILDAVAFAASDVRLHLETRVEPKYRGYRFRDDDPVVRLAVEALEPGRVRAATRRSRAAQPTRTSSTSAASRASTSRTG